MQHHCNLPKPAAQPQHPSQHKQVPRSPPKPQSPHQQSSQHSPAFLQPSFSDPTGAFFTQQSNPLLSQQNSFTSQQPSGSYSGKSAQHATTLSSFFVASTPQGTSRTQPTVQHTTSTPPPHSIRTSGRSRVNCSIASATHAASISPSTTLTAPLPTTATATNLTITPPPPACPTTTITTTTTTATALQQQINYYSSPPYKHYYGYYY